jgi:formylglycine-generating enzyme required for sulfatase activity
VELLAAWRSRPRGLAALFSALVLGALGFLPQLAGPGYEAALIAGLVLPVTAAIAAGLEVLATRASAADGVRRGATIGAGLAAAGFLLVLLHGLRVGFCDPSEGLWLYVLGPLVGSVLGGVWGALAALGVTWWAERRTKTPRRLVVLLLAFAGPLAGVLVSLLRFYTSPMVFAFDPFFGVFSGPLYDTVVNVVDRLVSYRAGTAATLVAVALGARLFDLSRAQRFRAVLFANPGLFALALASALASLAHSADGSRQGHWSTAASIAEALGGRFDGARCEVVHARAIPLRDVRLFTKDCDAALPLIEDYFGARGPERVRVYLFANEAEKGWLMGASHTYIAKPWRREVYVQASAYPHPVIVHELAHVVAGSFGAGPFRVAGPLAGLLPDPGRIEGFAVAAAPDETNELTEEEWAASMLKLGILPPLSQVFQLDFLSLSASKAYTVAGAFVTFLGDRYGKEALRRWYGGASLPEVTGGKELAALDAEFRTMLTKLSIPERSLATAKARFERPAFFERRCPRIVDRQLGEAAGFLDGGDVVAAERGFREALRLDPSNLDARFGLAGCARRAGNNQLALERFITLAKAPELPRPTAARAFETGGDLALQNAQSEQAKALYAQALALVFDADRRRTLEVKSLASEGVGREAITALLIGDRELGPSFEVAAPLIQAWADAEPTHDLPPYLIGRNLFGSGRYADAAKYLDRSLATAPKLPSVRREALRLRLITSCALGDTRRAGEVLALGVADPELPKARAEGLRRVAARCGVASLTAAAARGPLGSVAAAASASAAVASASAASTAPPPACPSGMRLVPGGRFWIGSEPEEEFSADESPRFLTELAPFCMDETEVTAGAYTACVERGDCVAPPREHLLCNFARTERTAHPMNCVSWQLADAYCRARAARLPSEFEFEFVARGGDRYQKYPWGNDAPDGRACWKHPGTCPVKSFAPGAFGLSDVSGNVWEWTATWYGSYPWPPSNAFAKVYRGGSFSRRFEKWMHTRLRDRAAPHKSGAHLGFRCASTPDPERCPFGQEAPGICRHGVIERACPKDKAWNGVRCASAGEPPCNAGFSVVPGHGCESDLALAPEVEDVEAAMRLVTRQRTPALDTDCRKNSRDRPQAFRYAGGSHAARNRVSQRSGCKNRDVGVGWNSTCCP